MIDLGQVFDAHHAALFRYLVRLVGDRELAADAAQEAFLRLAERPPARFDNIKAWLYTVATNYAYDTLKIARGRARLAEGAPDRLPIADPELTPDVTLERSETRDTVQTALGRLRPQERTTLLMRAEGFSYREIAAALEVSANSVGVIAARGLRKLAGVLQPEEAQL